MTKFRDIAGNLSFELQREARVEVTAAELGNINTTNKTLIATPGANLAIQVISIDYFFDYVSVAYTSNTTLRIMDTAMDATSVWEVDISPVADTNRRANRNGAGLTQPAANAALLLRGNGTGNPGGSGNGKLIVYVYYRIISTTSAG